jgi:RNA polymerase sigma-70 factor (ECF subfamily)
MSRVRAYSGAGDPGDDRGPDDALDPDVDFREVVVRLRDDIFRYARSLSRSDADAEDLAQAAVVRALERGAVLRDLRKAKWYLLRIVHNLAIDQARARTRVVVELHAELPDAAASDPAPDEIVELHAEHEIPRAAVASLAPWHQEVLRLRFLEDLDYRGVASRLDVTEHAARQRVYRAMQELRALLRTRPIRPV